MTTDEKAREIALAIVREVSSAGLCDDCVDDFAAALLSAENEAYERAAKVADSWDYHSPGQPSVPRTIATAIRALKDKGE